MKKPLLVIVGPTAVGKTAYSLEIAKRFPVEIISGDSVQVYRGMDIGSAKASSEELEAVPHHMIDLLNPDEPFTVADFQQRAASVIADIQGRGRLPMIVGGTGLYVESVVYDYHFPEAVGDTQVRERWNSYGDEYGPDALHAALAERDPASAARIHTNDRKRLVRALEVIELTGAPLSSQAEKREKSSPYQLCMIGLTMERSKLYERIERRVDLMMEQGLLEEVKGLLSRGYEKVLPSMQAIGYKEMVSYLEGHCAYEEAVVMLKRNTRRFAKRQLSWFRAMPQIHWIDVTETGNFRTHCASINDIITTEFQTTYLFSNSPRA